MRLLFSSERTSLSLSLSARKCLGLLCAFALVMGFAITGVVAQKASDAHAADPVAISIDIAVPVPLGGTGTFADEVVGSTDPTKAPAGTYGSVEFSGTSPQQYYVIGYRLCDDTGKIIKQAGVGSNGSNVGAEPTVGTQTNLEDGAPCNTAMLLQKKVRNSIAFGTNNTYPSSNLDNIITTVYNGVKTNTLDGKTLEEVNVPANIATRTTNPSVSGYDPTNPTQFSQCLTQTSDGVKSGDTNGIWRNIFALGARQACRLTNQGFSVLAEYQAGVNGFGLGAAESFWLRSNSGTNDSVFSLAQYATYSLIDSNAITTVGTYNRLREALYIRIKNIPTATNTQKGVCNAKDATSATSPSEHIATSTGNPADSVYCDVIVRMDVPETISLTVNNNNADIGTPTPGVDFGFKESGGTAAQVQADTATSSSTLEAKVSTNSEDGYYLTLHGISDVDTDTTATTNATCYTGTPTALCAQPAPGNPLSATASKIATLSANSSPMPAALGASAQPWWGYRIYKPAISATATTDGASTASEVGVTDYVCVGRSLTYEDTQGTTVTVPTTPSNITTKANCESTTAVAEDDGYTDYTAATNGKVVNYTNAVWQGTAYDGTNVTDALFIPTPTGPSATPVTTGDLATIFKPVPDDVTPAKVNDKPAPVTADKTFFRFGAQIKASTPAGSYAGKVRLTAVPSV